MLEEPSDSEVEPEQWLNGWKKSTKLLSKSYAPHHYYKDVNSGTLCHNCQNRHHQGETIEQVVVGSEVTSTFPIKIQGLSCNVLIDIGATKSCVSETYFKFLPEQNIKNLQRVIICLATGSNLCPIGFATCEVEISNKKIQNNFIICKHPMHPVIIGRDFIYKNDMKISYYRSGHTKLEFQEEELVAQVQVTDCPPLSLKGSFFLPSQNLAVVDIKSGVITENIGQMFEVAHNPDLQKKHINLQVVPMVHHVDTFNDDVISCVLVNLGDDDIWLKKGQTIAKLENLQIDVSEISTDTAHERVDVDEGYHMGNEESSLPVPDEEGTSFITLPVDVEGHQKAKLKDIKILSHDKQKFEKLCKEFGDVFSSDSQDIRKMPLIMMDIDMGDHPPICQRSYTLPLKHAEWVKRELHILENAGVIVCSVLPWTSPIVVVLKRSALGEPPKWQLCVDFRALSKLLPPVQKAFSNAKGILSLVPLPKIDDMYANLKGAKVFSALDFHSGYHHVELTADTRPKTAFMLSMNLGKWEFIRCPFGLSQAPAYFQRLANEVLAPFDFTFGYLDDILIYSPDVETHLKHLRLVFERL